MSAKWRRTTKNRKWLDFKPSTEKDKKPKVTKPEHAYRVKSIAVPPSFRPSKNLCRT